MSTANVCPFGTPSGCPVLDSVVSFAVGLLVGGLAIHVAVMNLLGSSLAFVWRDPSERALNGALGFAAGVMLAAAFRSLTIPGIEVYPDGNAATTATPP